MNLRWNWSISICAGTDPRHLTPAADTPTPVLSRADVTDVPASFVADPFMLQHAGSWRRRVAHVLRGVERRHGARRDRLRVQWRWARLALRAHGAAHALPPLVPVRLRLGGCPLHGAETRQDGAVNLFVADDFPFGWRKAARLLDGDFADASLFRHDDRWWMFVLHGTEDLMAFHADDLFGPWQPHAANPLIVGDPTRARPAGRPVLHDGGLIRYAQDCLPAYGFQVRAMNVTTLSAAAFHEEEAANSPILKPTRKGWNALKMHHVDAMQQEDGSWLACVDGATLVRSKQPAPEGISQNAPF
ncbi:MAG: hypothetical protein R2854_04490 [Caldilineaceae bacterium]